jgi:malate dehydrogenase
MNRTHTILSHLSPPESHAEGEEKSPVCVLVTGAAGQIAYSILPIISSGQMLGPNQPIILHLLDIPAAANAMDGVVLELQDCKFPLLRKVIATVDIKTAFSSVDIAILIGAFPRLKGMERAQLLEKNAAIFKEQGIALATHASRDVKVLVVGNPANTNCLIAYKSAKTLPAKNFTAMTMLDHNRAVAQVRLHLNLQSYQHVQNLIIWGNHSANQYPDLSHATITNYPLPGMTSPVLSVVNDKQWVRDVFIPCVQQRGAKIIEAR